MYLIHQVHLYCSRVPQRLSPRPNWDPQPSLPHANVSPPPPRSKGMTYSPGGGGGGPNPED